MAFASGTDEVTWKGFWDVYGATHEKICRSGITAGDIIVVTGDYSVVSMACILSLATIKSIVVPLTQATRKRVEDVLSELKPKAFITFEGSDVKIKISKGTSIRRDENIDQLREMHAPGLILFTSGSTGQPKGVVHNLEALLKKFLVERPAFRTINFLMFDHWGGLNTFFHCASNGSFVVFPKERSPDQVCALIEKYKIELLPCTPSFINLMLLSKAHKKFDLSSLKVITYGAEPMPDYTLKGLVREFPDIKCQQTYGMIEIGVLRSKSKSNDSLWVKLGGEGFKLRVVDGMLEVKSDFAMLGYLYFENSFTEDGWFRTQDLVVKDGEYLKILGRHSDLINVGGEKVYPLEVENKILSFEGVVDVIVIGEPNPLLGSQVAARVQVKEGLNEKEFKLKIKKKCVEELPRYMVPLKIYLQTEALASTRQKKIRH